MTEKVDSAVQTANIFIVCTILICALTLYLQSLSFNFVYDDEIQITANQLVNQPDAPLFKNIYEIFRHPTPPGDLYRPVTSLSYFLNVKAFGLSPQMFHLINILLYAACCVLAWLLIRQLVADLFVCTIATLIFVTHPIHVEAVANIVGRGELLAFGLAALALITSLKTSTRPNSNLVLIPAPTFILALGAMLAKESAICLVLLAPIITFFVRRKETKQLQQALYSAIPFILASIVYATLRFIVLKDHSLIETSFARDFAENPLLHLSLSQRLVPSLYILGRYIQMLVLPINLSADYSIMPQAFLAGVYSLKGMLLALLPLLLFLVIYRFRHQAWSIFGLWFFASFLLTINLLVPIGTLMGDRLAFAPSFGFIVLICGIFGDILSRRILVAASIALVIAFGFLTWQREQVWSDNGTLFKQTISDNSQSPKAYFNYASHLARTSNEIGSVAILCKKSLELDPNYLLATVCMLDVAHAIQSDELIRYWANRVLELDPQDENAQTLLKASTYK